MSIGEGSKKIAVVGAGFSGLTIARRLQQAGFLVEVFESSDRPGGLIESHQPGVLVETAAHALLSNQEVETLFSELNLIAQPAGFVSHAKWIFRDRARRWPLKVFESFHFIIKILVAKIKNKLSPLAGESLGNWAIRNGSQSFKNYLLAPAFQGVYGAQPEELASALIVGHTFRRDLRAAKGKLKGSIAPTKGMQELIEALADDLTRQNVIIHYQAKVQLSELEKRFSAIVIATGTNSAAQLVSSHAPKFSIQLSKLPKVSLTTVTIAVTSIAGRPRGFGCLFPKAENFNSLGVLFNTDIFAGRGPSESETWIFDKKVEDASDSEVMQCIHSDRARIAAKVTKIELSEIIRWPAVLPLYGIELENLLASDLFQRKSISENIPVLDVFYDGAKLSESQYPIYLTGNYLGGIGLAKILAYNTRLAARLKTEILEVK